MKGKGKGKEGKGGKGYSRFTSGKSKEKGRTGEEGKGKGKSGDDQTNGGQERLPRAPFDMTYVKCFSCNKYGHMTTQCRKQGRAVQRTVQTWGGEMAKECWACGTLGHTFMMWRNKYLKDQLLQKWKRNRARRKRWCQGTAGSRVSGTAR